MPKLEQHFLDWVSEVPLERVFETGASKTYPHRLESGLVLYLTSVVCQDSAKLRSTLCIADTKGDLVASLPEPFDLHSDIHEYGGRPFWLFGESVMFLNRADRCLYLTKMASGRFSSPRRVSPLLGGFDGVDAVCLSDVCLVSENHAVAIAEVHRPSLEPEALLVSWCFDQPDQPLSIVHQGADFYSNLNVDASGTRVAWMEWQHPNMPWDSNALVLADLDSSGGVTQISNLRRSGQNSASYCQLTFSAASALFCVADFAGEQGTSSDFWNVYEVNPDSLETKALSSGEKEFGYPHWQFGDTRLTTFGDRFMLGIASEPAIDSLWICDQRTGAQRYLQASGTLSHLQINAQGQGAVVEMPRDGAPRLILFDLSDDGELSLAPFAGLDVSDADISEGRLKIERPQLPIEVSLAEHFSYPTRDGECAYAFYYPPANAIYTCDLAPPVIVMVHGGPTSRAYGHFDLQKQFWTSSGFAVVDVNHRGSSGYGRTFRDALYEGWGETDCDDIVDCIDYLAKAGRIDPRAVCIRGKSAGGYAVLRALTQYPDVFAAGASYYGIGDLATLAEITHKFEKHYTDRLLGEPYDRDRATQADSRYVTRSPIHYIDRVNTPMAIFQGSLDKVVPPKLAHDFVNALRQRGVEHTYHEYPDEAHGFKNPANNIAAWRVELSFYRSTLRAII